MTVVLAEFAPLVFWAFDVARWIRGLDELQRRITLASLFFALSASLFLLLLWLRLDRVRFFDTVFGKPFMNNTWGIYSVADVYVFLSTFYGSGYLYFKSRHK